MKQYLIILLLVVICGSGVFAQEFGVPRGMDQNEKRSPKSANDSLGYNSVKPGVKSWKLSDQFSRKDSILVDTLMDDLQIFNPIFKKSISNAYLGNLGSPYQSNIYIDRKDEQEFLFLKPYAAYLKQPANTYYYDTKTPFTSLLYATAGPRGRAENLLKVLHTQNISPNWNFGVNYNLISSDGQYMYQKTRVYDISFFTNYKKDRYDLHLMVNQNRISVVENGGIINDTLVTRGNEEAQNIQVNLPDSRNKLTNFNFFMNHGYFLGEGAEIVKGKDTLQHYPARVVYTMEYESDKRKFVEEEINNEFFKNSFISDQNTLDWTEFSSMRNTVQLILNENQNKWIRLGARFMLGNQLLKYSALEKIDPVVWAHVDKNFHNNFVLASLYSQSGDKWNWNANAKYYFEGYRQNDMKLSYDLTRWFDKGRKQHGITAFAAFENRTPDFLLTQYTSNHHIWNNSFESTKDLEVGFKYVNKAWNLEIGAQVNQMKDYIFFNSDTLPQQTGRNIRVATAYVQKNFVLGNFHLNQKVVGQNCSDEDIIPLPSVSLFSNNYYQNTFFGGALDIQTGFSVSYNTKFYAPGYMPSTGQFFVQKEKELGDYPVVDLYFNFRIKRTRFFLKYEHLNAQMGSRNYFTTLHYPLNPAMFKYGLIWTFYN